MCGFFAVVRPTSSGLHNFYQSFEKIQNTLHHRGPDNNGGSLITGSGHIHNFKSSFELNSINVSSDLRAIFLHSRLSIISPTEEGNQPMHLHGSTIVFNGEIYNYLELKETLLNNGFKFTTLTDTEVILAAYRFWGVNAFNYFNGDWAIVILDHLSNKLIVSRDRFAVKPLYWLRQTNGELILSSEILPILLYLGRLDIDFTHYYRSFFSRGTNEWSDELPKEFQGIQRFPKASFTEISLLNTPICMKPIQFWSRKSSPISSKPQKFCSTKAREYASQYYEILSDSVKLRLRSDVPISCAFSGGLDSSSILYLINKHIKESSFVDICSVSCVYSDKDKRDCDESQYINILSDTLPIKNIQVEPHSHELQSEYFSIIKCVETLPDSSCMSGWSTYKKTRANNVLVSLDGQGADEQLAGYVCYISNHISHLPSLYDLLHEFSGSILKPGMSIYVLIGTCFRLMSTFLNKSFLYRLFRRFNIDQFVRPLDEQLHKAFDTSLVNLLHYGDRLSMGNSVESRLPFLDYRLVEFLDSIPSAYKLHSGWTKYIARLAFADKLPPSIVWRRNKMGWENPHASWLNGPLRNWSIYMYLMYAAKYFNYSPSAFLRLPIRKRIRLLSIAVHDFIFNSYVQK